MKYEKKTNSARICVLSLFDIRAEHPNEMNEKHFVKLRQGSGKDRQGMAVKAIGLKA